MAADQLAGLFAQYREALESRDETRMLSTARGVYEHTEANLPVTSRNRAAAQLNYGKALLASRQFAEARQVLGQALDSYKNVYGESARELIDPLMEMALLEARSRRSNVASAWQRIYRRYLDEALAIAEREEGIGSYQYSKLALEAGRIAVDLGGDRRASRYLEFAHAAFSGAHRDHAHDAATAGFYMGKYHMMMKNYAEAEPFLVSALRNLEGVSESDTRLSLTIRAFLVEIYDALGEAEKSIAQSRAIGSMTPFDMDQEPVPIFRGHPPRYPRSAMSAGKSGYVILSFTIADTGLTDDIRVVAIDGPPSFADAASEFVSRLRFAPRFVDGSPVPTPGRKFRVNFNMVN